MSAPPDWLSVHRGEAPLVVSLPHTGTDIPPAGADIPPEIEARLVSLSLARKDADWWVDRLYDFAENLGATMVRTAISRTVIDVNRDPSGASLYPGQTTTGLCPLETFDGEPLYRPGKAPDATEIEARRASFFTPYHEALAAEIGRLHTGRGRVVLYDAHSIRSRVPRLFEGELPHFNIGTNGGRSCDPGLTRAVEAACAAPGWTQVTDGRFRGGWTTRHYGRPEAGVHAIQMELADRGYMDEPAGPLDEANWPPPYDPARAESLQTRLREVLGACLAFAENGA